MYLAWLNEPSGCLDLISAYSATKPALPFDWTDSTNCSIVRPWLASQCKLSSSENPLLADDGGGSGETAPIKLQHSQLLLCQTYENNDKTNQNFINNTFYFISPFKFGTVNGNHLLWLCHPQFSWNLIYHTFLGQEK